MVEEKLDAMKAGVTHHQDDGDVDAVLNLAVRVEERSYSPWSKSLLRLYLVLFCAYLCGCLNGYDGSLMGGLNGMSAYQKYFDMLVFLLSLL